MPLPDHLERLQLEVLHAQPRDRLLVLEEPPQHLRSASVVWILVELLLAKIAALLSSRRSCRSFWGSVCGACGAGHPLGVRIFRGRRFLWSALFTDVFFFSLSRAAFLLQLRKRRTALALIRLVHGDHRLARLRRGEA